MMHYSSFSCNVFISFLSLFSVLDSISDRILRSLKFLTYSSSSSNNVFHQYSFSFLVLVSVSDRMLQPLNLTGDCSQFILPNRLF